MKGPLARRRRNGGVGILKGRNGGDLEAGR
jgi:hypothetical protein